MLLVMAGRRTDRWSSKEESGGAAFFVGGFSILPPSLGLFCLLGEAMGGPFLKGMHRKKEKELRFHFPSLISWKLWVRRAAFCAAGWKTDSGGRWAASGVQLGLIQPSGEYDWQERKRVENSGGRAALVVYPRFSAVTSDPTTAKAQLAEGRKVHQTLLR